MQQPLEWIEIRWHGRGGQGAVTASRILASAALQHGLFFQSLPSFGAERSGAPVMAFTRISRHPITLRCQIMEPQVVVVLDHTLLQLASVLEGLGPEGVLLVNSPGDSEFLRRTMPDCPGQIHTVDASRIATETLGRHMPNTPMLGALIAVTGLVSLEACEQALGNLLPARLGEKMRLANIEALRLGHAQVRSEGSLPLLGRIS
ncbi:MAG: 2-oxoacid:acceptor oxidoreductase family protein [Dehalococcoidia bacterium]